MSSKKVEYNLGDAPQDNFIGANWPHDSGDKIYTDYEKFMKDQAYLKVGRPGEVIEYIPEEGKKFDTEKPDLSLLPRELLEETAKAFSYGAKKYGRYNFRAGMDHHRTLAAAMRHLVAYNEGEDLDPESGVSHLGHAAASIAMLLVFVNTGVGKDTRYKK